MDKYDKLLIYNIFILCEWTWAGDSSREINQQGRKLKTRITYWTITYLSWANIGGSYPCSGGGVLWSLTLSIKSLTYSTYMARYSVTLKWLPTVFVILIQSQRMVMDMVKYSTATTRLRIYRTSSHSYEICSAISLRWTGTDDQSKDKRQGRYLQVRWL
jgi:hypothetical protein